jgi:hypothetical protein
MAGREESGESLTSGDDGEAALVVILERTLAGLRPASSNKARRFRPVKDVPLGELGTHPDLGDLLRELVEGLPATEFGIWYRRFAAWTDGRAYALAQGTHILRFRVGTHAVAAAVERGAETDAEFGSDWVRVNGWSPKLPRAAWRENLAWLSQTAHDFVRSLGR